ncbi:GntR family transcriptional regulator [Lacticaseibacillus jixiensis]|uniref:GntR family transcriptional regulator n=1 Tax=Lacticaseibacillus jixiensis TaxID=3231926 RepID=UPI0036F2B00A
MDDPQYTHLAYYQRLVVQIKQQILQGVLMPDDKLPSVRDMAKQMQLNPNTVAKAYKQLESEQVIYVKPGQGSFVRAATPPDDAMVRNLQARFKTVVVSALSAGVTEVELQQWLQDAAKGGAL